MDNLKHRAGENLEALHVAAVTAAGNGRAKVHDVTQHSLEAIRKIKEAFNEIWHHELIAESRVRIAAFARDAVQRVKDGAPLLSPVLLYEELVALFKDRVWRRSMALFLMGAMCGGCAGVALGLRLGARAAAGPHARALHTHHDQSVVLVEDAVTPAAGAGEVLIRVQAFSACCADRAALRGRGSALRALLGRPAVTVGRGFAGVVLDVGLGADALELGDEVWGCAAEWAPGAAAELLTVRSTLVSKRPRALAADAAASLPWAGAAALAALQRLHYDPENCKGKRVAVCGAGSGEGCVLVQLLSLWGANVAVLAPRHAALTLQDLGATEFVDVEGGHVSSWEPLEQHACRRGPWDAVLACSGAGTPPTAVENTAALLKSTAPRNAVADLRPSPLLSDRLPAPLSLLFAASFYTFRVLRWMVGCGWHTDWLWSHASRAPGLETLARLVDEGHLRPVLDKVYLPQEFETALAHACSDEAIGTTVVRFP